jgi:integrase
VPLAATRRRHRQGNGDGPAQRIRVPGRKRGEPLSDVAMWMTLRDMHPSITVHGFRSSFRDWAGEETNTPHDVCEAALAHTRKDETHAAY